MVLTQITILSPYVAGIFGHRDTGAYSIALSGGYADDVDLVRSPSAKTVARDS